MEDTKEVIEKDRQYEVHLCCGDCLHQLNSVSAMSGEDLSKRWTGLVTSSGFVAGNCPNGCRATYSDLNINTKLLVWDVEDARYVDNWKFWHR